jgi:hypothetical protein
VCVEAFIVLIFLFRIEKDPLSEEEEEEEEE